MYRALLIRDQMSWRPLIFMPQRRLNIFSFFLSTPVVKEERRHMSTVKNVTKSQVLPCQGNTVLPRVPQYIYRQRTGELGAAA